jgi:hypothetical protein
MEAKRTPFTALAGHRRKIGKQGRKPLQFHGTWCLPNGIGVINADGPEEQDNLHESLCRALYFDRRQPRDSTPYKW